MLRGMWELPGPGLEPVSPALAGEFLTTAPLRKPMLYVFVWSYISPQRTGILEINNNYKWGVTMLEEVGLEGG